MSTTPSPTSPDPRTVPTLTPKDTPVPPPPGAVAGPPSTLVVHVDLFSRAAATKSNVYLDGVRMVNRDGPNPYAVAPGRHMVSAEVNAAGRTYGQADLQVEVPTGTTVEVFYAAPASLTTPGRLAFEPVKNAGAGSVWAQRGCGVGLLAFMLVVIVVAFVRMTPAPPHALVGPGHAPASVTASPAGAATG